VHSSSSTFRAADGLELAERAWLPESETKAVLVIIHGYAEHSGRYEHVAERLVAAQYAIYALDLRGHGLSEGDRAVVRSFDQYISDVAFFLDRVRSRHPDLPMFIVGHSMGGLIVSLYLTKRPAGLAGAVLSGPAVKAPGGGAAHIGEWVFRAIGRLFPGVGVATLDSSKVSRDPAEVEKYDADPLNYHGKMKAGLVGAFSKAIRTLEKHAPKIDLPVAIFHGGADGLADPEGSRILHERVSSQDKTLRVYDGLFHEIFNEPERDQVLSDVIAWLDEHVAAAR
jgi:alpha-beta hydrolase superfamily lysophospholipase